MLHTTHAVVLRTFKHGDRSTVLRAYTELFGARSYMVRIGGRNASRNAALQPLSRVELVVSETGERDMHAVRDLRIERPYVRTHAEPMRGVLALFAQEVFYRTLREESADPGLYAFVQAVLESMDTDEDLAHHPLRLLVNLSRHLGFFPEAPSPGEDRFDLREGCFFKGDAPHDLCMEPSSATLFATLLEGRVPSPSSAEVRRRLLDDLLIYYRLHVEGFGELRSPEVLRAVMG